MKTIYLAIAGRIRQELEEITQVVERVEQIWRQYKSSQPSENDFLVDAAALNLHGFYAGIERLLEIVADGIDKAKPAGPVWHRELLQQMTAEIPGVRPTVLDRQTRIDNPMVNRHTPAIHRLGT